VSCDACEGSGHCPVCYKIRLKWKQASDLARAGDSYNAVVVLQEMLKSWSEDGQKAVTTGRMGGAGGGAVLGTMILPGVGTIVGGFLGSLLGSSLGKFEAKSVIAFEAETNYRLGLIYEGMHHPASLTHYMNAKLLDPSHTKAAEALARLQPKVPVSPMLDDLDDDL